MTLQEAARAAVANGLVMPPCRMCNGTGKLVEPKGVLVIDSVTPDVRLTCPSCGDSKIDISNPFEVIGRVEAWLSSNPAVACTEGTYGVVIAYVYDHTKKLVFGIARRKIAKMLHISPQDGAEVARATAWLELAAEIPK